MVQERNVQKLISWMGVTVGCFSYFYIFLNINRLNIFTINYSRNRCNCATPTQMLAFIEKKPTTTQINKILNDKFKQGITNKKRRTKMRHKKLKLSAILLLGLELTGLQAQEVIPATGGKASGSGGSANYSIGQVVYTTNTGVNGTLAQGVQQPFEISVITGLEKAKGINLICSTYPNPTTDFLTLKVDASTTLSIQSMSYQLYDMSGKLLENKKLDGNQTNIVTSNLVPATYFLKVTENNKDVKTFKIIKN
jgi:hypothetical protein